MAGIEQQVRIDGDRELFERVSERLRDPRDLFRMVGVMVMSHAAGRLEFVLSQDEDAVRTGQLAASLHVTPDGSGSGHTIFDLGGDYVRVGTNLPYAAQVQYGGRIEPKPPRKALAIPLPAKLKRAAKRGTGLPSVMDPDRELLTFIPMRGGASGNVIGLLVDDENLFGMGEGEALFALARYVDQEPRPFLTWGEPEERKLNDTIFPVWLEVA